MKENEICKRSGNYFWRYHGRRISVPVSYTHLDVYKRQAAPYEPERFYQIAKGYEKEPEGGERCLRCYELRLREAAMLAAKLGYDYFTTTLTISPLKRADKLNEIGEQLKQEYGVAFLPSDFKKKNGYKRSIELSKEYGLYRQDYCGCVYSIRDNA